MTYQVIERPTSRNVRIEGRESEYQAVDDSPQLQEKRIEQSMTLKVATNYIHRKVS